MFYLGSMGIQLRRKIPTVPRIPEVPGAKTLLPHQAEAVAYLLRKGEQGKGGSLFMEMRLGKTLAFIRFAKNRFGQVLVICPLTVCKTWMLELEGEGETSVAIVGGMTPKKREALLETFPKWIIINYEACEPSKIYQWLRKDCAIVVDESLRVANPQAKITKALLSPKKFPQRFKYLLCGNPAPEGIMQYTTQMLLTDGSFLGKTSYWAIRSTHFLLNGFQWAPKPGVEALFKDAVHSSCFVRSRKECGIGSDKVYQRRFVKMTPAQKKAYASMLSTFEIDNLSTDYVTTQLLYLARIAGGMIPKQPGDDSDPEWVSDAKVAEISDLIGTELAGQQLIVWFRFKAEVMRAWAYLRKAHMDLNIHFITGDVSPAHRELLRGEFLEGRIDIMLMTIATSKVGTDWSSADTEIYHSNEYSSDARTQSEDRIVHPKKTEPLLVIDILTEGSVDEDVLRALKEKRIASSMFLSKIWRSIFKKRGS